MKKTILLLILCSFTFQSQCHRHQDFGETAMKAGIIGLGAAGAASALYGGYKFLDWLFTRTDEQVVADVRRLIQETERYQSMDSILLQYHVTSPTAFISESCLYDLGYEKIHADYIDTYISKLYYVTRRLRSETRELSQRMVELPYSTIYSQMNNLRQQVQACLPRIELLHASLKHHRGYYLLFEFESDMIGDYETELAIVQHAYDEYEITTKLKRLVMVHNTDRFPYMQYTQMVEKDIKELQYKINWLSSAYPERYSAAKELEEELQIIKTILTATSEYHIELQIHQQEKRERERYEIGRNLARLRNKSSEDDDILDELCFADSFDFRIHIKS